MNKKNGLFFRRFFRFFSEVSSLSWLKIPSQKRIYREKTKLLPDVKLALA